MRREQLEQLERCSDPPFERRIETHISWVLVGARDVFKIKRPVSLGFLDFTTLQARKEACEREVVLNRRLAPHVYEGVLPLTAGPGGGVRWGGEGPPIEYAVHMKRVSDAHRCDHRLREGRLQLADIRQIAVHLAEFHASMGPLPDPDASLGEPEAIEKNVLENFAQTRMTIHDHVTPEQATTIETWQRTFLREHRGRFSARRAHGRIRDGHGDLRLEHIYLDDAADPASRITILDCIEFNDRFRFADVAADIAFLAMDLAAHRRVDGAEALLAAYAEHTNDYDLYGVIDFYESYRAFVRGKVAALLAADPEVAGSTRQHAAEAARKHFLLALASERHSLLRPRLVILAGIIASGKSRVAQTLGERMSAPVIASDRTRKGMLSVTPTTAVHEDAWQGAYAPGQTDAVYAEVLRRARVVLESGRPVIVDASFRTRSHRAAARALAEACNVPWTLVECRVRPSIARQRLRSRAAGPSVSDGREAVLDDFIARWETVDELDPKHHVILDTEAPWSVTCSALESAFALWPPELAG